MSWVIRVMTCVRDDGEFVFWMAAEAEAVREPSLRVFWFMCPNAASGLQSPAEGNLLLTDSYTQLESDSSIFLLFLFSRTITANIARCSIAGASNRSILRKNG
jgi:hypothetical protein